MFYHNLGTIPQHHRLLRAMVCTQQISRLRDPNEGPWHGRDGRDGAKTALAQNAACLWREPGRLRALIYSPKKCTK